MGGAASALVISPSAATWNAASAAVRDVRDTLVCVSGLAPDEVCGCGSAKVRGAAAMRSLRERLWGERSAVSPWFVTVSALEVMPGRVTPLMMPVRALGGATGGMPAGAEAPMEGTPRTGVGAGGSARVVAVSGAGG